MSASLLARLSAVTTVMLSLFWIHAGLGGWSTRGGPVYFNWHITLAIVAVACVLLGSSAFKTMGSVERPTRKKTHWVANTIATSTMLLAVCVAFQVKDDHGKPHLMSSHSWLGISTLVCLMCQLIGGVVAFLSNLLTVASRQAVTPWHRLSGEACAALSVITAIAGIVSKQKSLSEPFAILQANWITVGVLATACLTAYTLRDVPGSSARAVQFVELEGTAEKESLYPSRYQ